MPCICRLGTRGTTCQPPVVVHFKKNPPNASRPENARNHPRHSSPTSKTTLPATHNRRRRHRPWSMLAQVPRLPTPRLLFLPPCIHSPRPGSMIFPPRTRSSPLSAAPRAMVGTRASRLAAHRVPSPIQARPRTANSSLQV
jgi:hypothetical protein